MLQEENGRVLRVLVQPARDDDCGIERILVERPRSGLVGAFPGRSKSSRHGCLVLVRIGHDTRPESAGNDEEKGPIAGLWAGSDDDAWSSADRLADQSMTDHEFLAAPQEIAQARCSFEVESLHRVSEKLLRTFDDDSRLAAEITQRAFDERSVLGRRDASGAGADTAAQCQLQARAPVGTGIPERSMAGAQREELVEQLDDRTGSSRAPERPDVHGVVIVTLTSEHQARPRATELDFHVGVRLVIAELRIVRWLVPLDELTLQEECFQLRADNDRLDLGHRFEQPVHLAGVSQWLTEVGADSLPEIARLADIQDTSQRIAHEIHTRQGGCIGQQALVEHSAPAGDRLDDDRSPRRGWLEVARRAVSDLLGSLDEVKVEVGSRFGIR